MSGYCALHDVQTTILCSENWEDIKDEIKRSNILQVRTFKVYEMLQKSFEYNFQRDSHIFAKRLDSRLETYAKEVDKKVGID